jgi:hypothetical protein
MSCEGQDCCWGRAQAYRPIDGFEFRGVGRKLDAEGTSVWRSKSNSLLRARPPVSEVTIRFCISLIAIVPWTRGGKRDVVPQNVKGLANASWNERFTVAPS